MSHQIHTTQALVLGSMAVGDANKYFFLLTKDFGYIGALATGIRFQKSKLRYTLQDGAAITISLVKGRRTWRITHVFSEASLNPEKIEACIAFFRTALLVRRLLHMDEVQSELFALLSAFHQDIVLETYTKEEILAYELLVTGKILRILGYWNEDIEMLPNAALIDRDTLSNVYKNKSIFVEQIKNSLSASQL